MRKITICLVVLTLCLTLFCLGTITCYADEVSEDVPAVTEEMTENIPEDVSGEVTDEKGDSSITVDIAESKGFAYYYSLIYENIAKLFEEDNLNTVITWACSVLSILIVTLLKSSITRLKNKISGTLDNSTHKTDELVEGYNANCRHIEELANVTRELQTKLDEKTDIDREINENVRSFAEMLFLVYNGSTTIPEGMKDVLRTKYAKLERALSKEESGESA